MVFLLTIDCAVFNNGLHRVCNLRVKINLTLIFIVDFNPSSGKMRNLREVKVVRYIYISICTLRTLVWPQMPWGKSVLHSGEKKKMYFNAVKLWKQCDPDKEALT